MRQVIVGTAGHIDHGKSALVRALTGMDPDRLKEEKERGITIDLGFAHLERDGVNLAFVDVPGHERFVKNMLAGATGIDVVLLVVAADESVMPQTREHFDICRLLQVRDGLVILTKRDLVDDDTLELARLEVRDLVAGSFLAGAPVLTVSSRTGEGIDEIRTCLVELARRLPERANTGAARLPVDRVFSVKGFGTVVTGTLVGGAIRVDDELALLPEGRRVKVRGLHSHGASIAGGRAGQRLAVNLAGVEVGELARGAVLATPATIDATRRFDAVLELLVSAKPLRHGARVRFHHGTAELLGRVAISSVTADRSASAPAGMPGEVQGLAAGDIPPGFGARVRIRLESPAVLTRGDRFILRAYSPPVTIAGGAVLDPHPPRGGIRTEAGRARLARLDPGSRPFDEADVVVSAVGQMLDERAAAGLRVAELVSRAGLTPAGAVATVQRLQSAGRGLLLGEVVVAQAAVASLEHALVARLATYHELEPLSEGMPREEARARLFARAHPAVFEHVIGRLSGRGDLTGRDRLALSTHRVAPSTDETRAMGMIEQAFLDAGLRPPDPTSIATATGLTPGATEQAVRLLQRRRTLIRLDTLWFHAEALARLKEDVAGLRRAGADTRIDVATFKERYGVSRKFAIPLLEYLDRERVTRRVGETRVVL